VNAAALQWAPKADTDAAELFNRINAIPDRLTIWAAAATRQQVALAMVQQPIRSGRRPQGQPAGSCLCTRHDAFFQSRCSPSRLLCLHSARLHWEHYPC
jgi:hypothetical protein